MSPSFTLRTASHFGLASSQADSLATSCVGNLAAQRMDTIESQLIQLRPRLYAYARGKGLTPDDAEDLVSEAWIKTAQWNDAQQVTEQELIAYGFRALKSVMTDHWASPARVLSKRIDRVVSNPKGPDPIVTLVFLGQEYCGLQSQSTSGIQPSGSVEDLESRLSEFLYGSNGLGGESPSSMTTRLLVTKLLNWWAKPIQKSDLLRVLIALVPTQGKAEPIEDDLPGPSFDEPSDLGPSLMDTLLTLPFRMRASLLLNLEIDEFQALGRGGAPDLSSALEEWVPPPALESSLLPLDDELVATKLSVTKSYLHVIRNRARDMMRTHAYQSGLIEGGLR